MAGSSFFALLDDIATLLDDISIMSKMAVKKTAGVLGDDLALNAQQVTGMRANRELPVVWAVAKGSLVNKAILVPAALLISVFAPWGVAFLLMLGGAYLCYEGAEKLAHRFLHEPEERERHRAARASAVADAGVDMVAWEKTKIKGAVRTDFVLSAEIVAITLGIVAGAALPEQIAVMSGIALLMTAGVYGLVAGIIKLDDLGCYLESRDSGVARSLGAGIIRLAPYLMRGLSIVGTAAMFMVGGSILTHGMAPVHHAVQELAAQVAGGGFLSTMAATVLNALFGVIVGLLIVAVVVLFKRMLSLKPLPPER